MPLIPPLAVIAILLRRGYGWAAVSLRDVNQRVVSVEILSFDGCPNRERAVELVERVAAEIGVNAEIRVVDVADADTAKKLRFLGSPSVRVGGEDVEPGAKTRTDFVVCCRLYRTAAGVTGTPDERWVRAALLNG